MRTALRLAAVALVATAAAAGAQATDDPPAEPLVEPSPYQRPVRGLAGATLYYARPVGELAQHVRQGFGGAFHGTLFLDRAHVFGLRADASYLNYGYETVHGVCVLATNCRVSVDVTTTNNLSFFGIGPQLVVPRGPIRPYVAGQVGWTIMWTNSFIDDEDYDDEIDHHSYSGLDTENISDNTFSYGGLGGFLLPVTDGRDSLAIDIGVRYLRNGRMRYLREGDIVDNPSGPPTLLVRRSRVDLVTFYFGATVAIR